MDPMVEEVISQAAPAKGNAIRIGHSLGESLYPGPGLATEFIPEYDFARSSNFQPFEKKCHPLAPKAGDPGMV